MADSNSLIESIVGDTQTFLVQSSQLEAAAQARLNNVSKATADVGKIYTDVAQTAGAAKRQQLLADLETMQGMQNVAKAAGADPTAASDAITDLVSRHRAAQVKYLTATDELVKQENQSVSELGLGGWIASRFYHMVNLEDEQKSALTALDTTGRMISSTQKAIQDAGQIYSSIKQPLTAALIDPLVRAASADAQLKAIEAQQQSEKYALEALQVPLNASKERLATMHTLRAAQQAEAQFNLSMQNARQHIKEFELRMEAARIEREAREAGKTYEGVVLERINNYKRSRGEPEYTARDLPQIKSILGSKSPEAKKLNEAFAIGELQKKLGMRVFGTTPNDAAAELESTRPDLTEHQRPLAAQIIGIRSVVKQKSPYLKPEELEDAVNNAIKMELEAQNANIKPGSGNPRDIGPLENYIGTKDSPGIPEIVNLPVVSKVLMPMIEAGVRFDHPKSALEAAAKATLDGTITGSEFLDLAPMFQRANMVNLNSRGYASFGINTGLAGRTYHVNMGFGEQPIDVLSSSDLGQYLGKYLTRIITARDIRSRSVGKRPWERSTNPNATSEK